MARGEISKSKTRYTDLMTSNSTLQAQISALQATITEMNESFENEKKIHAVAISDRDGQIVEYKRQIASHILELKSLMDIKLSLDEEIGTYRRLLLSGGTSVTTGSATVVSGGMASSSSVLSGATEVVSNVSSNLVSSGAISGSMSSLSSSSSSSVAQSTAKTSFSGSSKGSAAVSETSTDGRFIVVENKLGSALDLSGWSIERSVDMGDLVVYKFGAGFSLGGFASVKIWANGVAGATSAAGNLIWTGGQSWGIGFNAVNELKNAAGGVEAKLIQKTTLG